MRAKELARRDGRDRAARLPDRATQRAAPRPPSIHRHAKWRIARRAAVCRSDPTIGSPILLILLWEVLVARAASSTALLSGAQLDRRHVRYAAHQRRAARRRPRHADARLRRPAARRHPGLDHRRDHGPVAAGPRLLQTGRRGAVPDSQDRRAAADLPDLRARRGSQIRQRGDRHRVSDADQHHGRRDGHRPDLFRRRQELRRQSLAVLPHHRRPRRDARDHDRPPAVADDRPAGVRGDRVRRRQERAGLSDLELVADVFGRDDVLRSGRLRAARRVVPGHRRRPRARADPLEAREIEHGERGHPHRIGRHRGRPRQLLGRGARAPTCATAPGTRSRSSSSQPYVGPPGPDDAGRLARAVFRREEPGQDDSAGRGRRRLGAVALRRRPPARCAGRPGRATRGDRRRHSQPPAPGPHRLEHAARARTASR